jgi:hypothetical protein
LVAGELHAQALGSQNTFKYGTAPGLVQVPRPGAVPAAGVGSIVHPSAAETAFWLRAFETLKEFESNVVE